MITILITDPDRKVISRVYGKSMTATLKGAIDDAKVLVSEKQPDLYLRDVLGGLRAEVRWRDGNVSVK